MYFFNAPNKNKKKKKPFKSCKNGLIKKTARLVIKTRKQNQRLKFKKSCSSEGKHQQLDKFDINNRRKNIFQRYSTPPSYNVLKR